jgi:hypothetical protein
MGGNNEMRMRARCEARSARQAEDLPSEAASVARVRFCEFLEEAPLTARTMNLRWARGAARL